MPRKTFNLEATDPDVAQSAIVEGSQLRHRQAPVAHGAHHNLPANEVSDALQPGEVTPGASDRAARSTATGTVTVDSLRRDGDRKTGFMPDGLPLSP